ncbi:hypothetical protein ABZP36_007266 [Zizania latifolia]
MPLLKSINLEGNQLEGPIPPELGNIISLERFFISANNITGELPSNFSRLTNMTDFRIDGTDISGRISSFIKNWQRVNRMQNLIFVLLFLLLTSQILHCYSDAYNEQEAGRVAFLPGQPRSPKVSQFSSYIAVNRQSGRALFYWFFEAQALTSQKPLLLWLNGGPGCSSIGYGAASELGPLRVSRYGTGLEFNKFAWNKEANLLFLESPVGVGFSYTNTSTDLSKLNDGFVGHYVPQLAGLVYERNKENNANRYIKLKGFIVGNPLTDDQYDSKGYDACYSSYAEKNFNQPDVQKAFHANVNEMHPGKWKVCCDSILRSYNFSVLSVLPVYSKLIKAGLRIWLYSGDADGRVPVIGSRYCMEALGLPIKRDWQPWYLNSQESQNLYDAVRVEGYIHVAPHDFLDSSFVTDETNMIQGALASHLESPHMGVQGSINLMEGISPNLSFGTHFGMDANRQHQVPRQPRMLANNFMQVFIIQLSIPI